MLRLAAVILAGGEGRRLGGVIKANIEIGGVRLLDRVIAALGPSPHPVLVASGRYTAVELHLPAGAIAVPDLETGQQGPLSGLAAAVDWLNRHDPSVEFLVSIAVDTPFLPPDFIARAMASMGSVAVVMARYEGQQYPTNAIWRLSAIADLPAATAAGTAPHSLRRLAQERGVAWLDWPVGAEGNPFTNINTPEELAAMRRRADGR
jgi:molybdopterin-guanine dinucleotide biosynthesis protein A